jgi:hypothetical protein
MTTGALLVLLALDAGRPPAPPPELELIPIAAQHAVLLLSDRVTAGGGGGGLGAQLIYQRRYLLQADIGMLLGFGNALATRLAAGVQLSARDYAPAFWASGGALWGDRVEFLTGAGERPATPSFALGARASPLRFVSELGMVSALELGAGTDLAGALWLELGVLTVGARF